MPGPHHRNSRWSDDEDAAEASVPPARVPKETTITKPSDNAHHAERTGLLFALAGFALLSVGDMIVKSLAGEWAPSAVAALRYSLGTIGLGLFVVLREGPGVLRMPRPRLQLLRGFGVAVATLTFFAAVFVMPLADATALIFNARIADGAGAVVVDLAGHI
jgi:threonine/homoserine efflux transporter RhtA